MFLCPIHAWIARVSWPAFARAHSRKRAGACEGGSETAFRRAAQPYDQCVEALGRHRAAALGSEDVRSERLFALKTAQGAELVALDGMNAWGAALGSANMQTTG